MNICSKNVVIDYRTDIKAAEFLQSCGFNVVFSKKILNLYEAVNGHTDLQLVRIDDTLICAPECYEHYKQFFDENLVCGTKKIKGSYPGDIWYNAAVFGKTAIHNFKYTDTKLYEEMKAKSLNLINVKQGYSKCSICIVSDNAIITDDEGIYKSAVENKTDALKITKGDVFLKGMNYGFFGGATGLYNDTLFVNGELKTHTDEKNIRAFCRNYNVYVAEMKKGTICDIGSVLFAD